MLGPFSCIQCIVWVIVGGLAGTIAGRLLRGKGYGPVGDIVLGLIGAAVGGGLFRLLGIGLPGIIPDICADIIVATVGAVIFIVVIRFFIDKNFAQ